MTADSPVECASRTRRSGKDEVEGLVGLMARGGSSPLRRITNAPHSGVLRGLGPRRDTAPVVSGAAEFVRSRFEAFLRGDWDALSQAMDPAVQWLTPEP